MLLHNIIKQKGSYTLLASHNLGQGNNEVKSNKVDYQKNYYVRVAWVTRCWIKKNKHDHNDKKL